MRTKTAKHKKLKKQTELEMDYVRLWGVSNIYIIYSY